MLFTLTGIGYSNRLISSSLRQVVRSCLQKLPNRIYLAEQNTQSLRLGRDARVLKTLLALLVESVLE